MKIKDIISYILIILVVVLIRTFIVTPIRVNGNSMYNTLRDGDFMLLKKYEKKSINRFDIVVIKLPNEKIIKRIIGLPGEDIEYSSDNLYINGELLEENYGYGNTDDFTDYCGVNEYFVLGDNRENSQDSRRIGCINKDDIMGTTDFIFFPFNKFGKVN